MTIAERLSHLIRQVTGLVLIGQVAKVDYSLARARVEIGDLESDWLPWLTRRAGGDVDWCAPEVGEQVLIVSPSGDPAQGVILGSLYSSSYAANAADKTVRRTDFGDGTRVEYDREAHRLTVSIPAEGEVKVMTAGKVTVVADDSVVVQAGGDIFLGASGNLNLEASAINIAGPVTQTGGDMTSDGISAQMHKHGGVMSGGSSTTPPV